MSIDNKASNPSVSDQKKGARIKATALQAGVELRERHTWLRYQNTIGVAIMTFAVLGMVASGALYVTGVIAWWLCIPVTAMFASLTHELEHDLIHMMYFRKRPWALNAMLAVAWMARPSTVNPWVRRNLHLHHHKHSGTPSDYEERAITNGERWGIARLLMTSDNMLSIILRVRNYPTAKAKVRHLLRGLKVYAPLGLMHWGLWYCFLAFHAIDGVAAMVGSPIQWSTQTLGLVSVLDVVTVVLIAPNVLRTFCLHFISSNMHYYGDVEDGNVMQQTQVLNAWWLFPLHMFCFNFGATHAIHHFLVKEPFYIRQATAKKVHAVMREQGVRFNDFGTFRRANRLYRKSDYQTDEGAAVPAAK